jgi:hypothetical protein
MRDSGVEVIASLDDLCPSSFAFVDTVTDTLERLVASRDLLSGHLAQGSLLGVVLHLHSGLLHGLDVADEADQVLHRPGHFPSSQGR